MQLRPRRFADIFIDYQAWKGIGQKAGTLVWRIENFRVVAQPADEFGQFFSGDSYIVLHVNNNVI